MSPETLESDQTEPTEEQVDQAGVSSPYGPDNRDLPEQLQEAIKAAIVEFQQQEKFSRRREVRKDRKNRFYEAGYQHLLWNNTGNAGFQQLTPGGTAYNAAGDSVQCPQYMDAYNIFFPYFRIVQAVLTQAIPGVDFQPLDPSEPADQDRAKAAEDYAQLFDRMNDLVDIMGQIVRMFGMSGRCISWTRTEEDSQKFGFEADEVTPKRFQKVGIYGTLESKVPITCKEFGKKTGYVFLYEDPDIKVAKDNYGWIKDKIKAGMPGLGENQYERTARLGLLSGSKGQNQTGDSLSHIVTELHAFLRPSAFTGALYDAVFEDDPKMTVKQMLLKLFPQGCRAVWIGDVYAQAFAESMDDHLDIQWPYQGDGMFRQAFMDSMQVVQDNFNDLVNWIREKVDTGAGSLWIRGDQDAVDAVTSQRAAPNAVRPAKDFAQSSLPLEDSFFKEDDPQIPETLFQLLQFLRGELPEFLLAALPSLQGGQMSDNKTASGYAQANAQAKGQLSIIWGRMGRMLARIRYQSALAASKEDLPDTVTIPSKDGQNTVINMAALKKGSFGCYPDEDSSFPESTAQKRALMDKLFEGAATSPMIAQLIDNPDNIAEYKRVNGFAELVLLPAEAREKQLHEIQKLLAESPLPPTQDEIEAANVQHAAAAISARAAGQPEPPPPDAEAMLKPSVEVDELDYHQWEFAKCQEWLSSAERRREDEKGNLKGVLNVKLHALEHRKFMLALAAQQAAMAPPPVAHRPPPAAPPKPAAPQPQPAGMAA